MQKNANDIAIFLIIVSALILFLVSFIIVMLYLYRKKQTVFLQTLEQAKLDNEKNILSAQLEIQEQTFQHISREIHDNISLSLTLAKLQLNTLDWENNEMAKEKITSSVELLSRSIHDLSDISKSMNADIISQQGLLGALENEIEHIKEANLFTIGFELTGIPVYMDVQKELIIFRIIQEAFNNIIKHAAASNVLLKLHYESDQLHIDISDNGTGFNTEIPFLAEKKQAGLKNMEARVKMLTGSMQVKSQSGSGTSVSFLIPFNQ
jgi:two-component system NarL family sensor kinase